MPPRTRRTRISPRNRATCVRGGTREILRRTGQGINNAPAELLRARGGTIEDLVSGAHYFVFSDYPELARCLIALPEDRVTTVSHNRGDANAYADLWLMTQATHFIIANSTFSWWGAWLAEQTADQIMMAPGFQMREGKMRWGFSGLLPERWIKV